MSERGRTGSPRQRITLDTVAAADALEARVHEAAGSAVRALAALLEREPPLGVLHALKFERVGFEPLHPARAHNLLEQVHQTFAYLAAVRGARELLHRHPEHAPLHLNLGTSTVPDLESADGALVAEVFAGLSLAGNRKVTTDLARLRGHRARLRYFIYHAPGAAPPEEPGIRFLPVTL